jgi:hypothetical protein
MFLEVWRDQTRNRLDVFSAIIPGVFGASLDHFLRLG